MSELKSFIVLYDGKFIRAYKESEADKVIAELKAQVSAHNNRANLWHYNAQNEHNAAVAVRMENAKLKATERRLRRALWLARAERASDKARIFYFNDLETMLDIDGFSYDSKKKKGHKKLTARIWRIIWLKVERKCRDKAEEYK